MISTQKGLTIKRITEMASDLCDGRSVPRDWVEKVFTALFEELKHEADKEIINVDVKVGKGITQPLVKVSMPRAGLYEAKKNGWMAKYVKEEYADNIIDPLIKAAEKKAVASSKKDSPTAGFTSINTLMRSSKKDTKLKVSNEQNFNLLVAAIKEGYGRAPADGIISLDYLNKGEDDSFTILKADVKIHDGEIFIRSREWHDFADNVSVYEGLKEVYMDRSVISAEEQNQIDAMANPDIGYDELDYIDNPTSFKNIASQKKGNKNGSRRER